MATVIFDFDGTLADTFPAIIKVSYELAGQQSQLSRAEIDALRLLPLLTAPRKLGVSWLYYPRLALYTRRRLKRYMKDAAPFNGISDMLAALHEAGHQLFILSSNYSENIRIFLKHHKLEKYFSGIEYVQYANAWTKTMALRRLAKKYNLAISECYHVGNEALDIRAANRVGMRGMAAAWGGYDQTALKATKPFAMINTPKELRKLLQ